MVKTGRVVVGGDAAGMPAVSQAKGRHPDLDVLALEEGASASYSS